MKTPREKYENDPHYNRLVSHLVSMIDAGQFTPSELREASIFAATIYEMTMKYPRPNHHHTEGVHAAVKIMANLHRSKSEKKEDTKP